MESTKPTEEKNMEAIQGGSGWNVQSTETKTSFDDGCVESTKPPHINDGSDDVAPSSSFSANTPVHQLIAVAPTNNGVKCGMKNRFIALGGLLLVATISTVAIMLTKEPEPNEKEKKPLTVPSTPLETYQPLLKIQNGAEAAGDSWPYMATLQGDDGHFCGGTLIVKDVLMNMPN